MNYKELCEEIEKKIQTNVRPGHKPPCVTSASDLTAMMQAMMNDPGHEVPTYSKKLVDESGQPTPVMRNPSKRYRESLKPILKQMGIDRSEVDRIDTLPMSKEHAAATVEMATAVIKDYITAGRRFVFPITSPTESQMSLAVATVPEKVTKPKHFVDEGGVMVPKPTGKTVTTKAHTVLKARNGTPFWLKSEEDSVD